MTELTPVREGGEFLVNTATASGQFEPSVTALADGGFVVTWSDNSAGNGGAGGDTSGSAIKGQRYDAAGDALGDEFLVNTATASSQSEPSVTALADGGFVVTWSDLSAGNGGAGGDASGTAIKGQRYDAAGAALGGEFLVNTATESNQVQCSVTALADGGFVVTWSDSSEGNGGAGGDTSNYAIKGQRYDAVGDAQGGEFLVNTATSGSQVVPSVTALADGGFVVTWSDGSGGNGGAGGDTSGSAIKGQRYDAAGAAQGGEFLVNTATASNQTQPSVTALADGGFVVTWSDLSAGNGGAGCDTSGYAIKGQRYDAAGAAQGGEFLVNTATLDNQLQSSVTALADGRFVVTWNDRSVGNGGAGGDTSNTAIKAQIFSAPSLNTAPEGADATITIDEDTSHTFAAADFGFTDVDASDELQTVRIDTLPAQGTLALDGTPVTAGQEIAAGDLGLLTFTPDADANGATYASFTFSVSDGTEFDAAPNTITLDVTPVNDPATGTVSISGTPTLGQTLTASAVFDDADGTSGAVPAYQWLRDGNPIAGADGETYELTTDDVGTQISVAMSFTDDGGTTETLTSGEITMPSNTVTVLNAGNNTVGVFSTIQDALAVAADGYTLELSAGTFVETGQMNVNFDITITGAGAGQTIIRSDGSPSGSESRMMQINADGVTISDLTFNGWTDTPVSANMGRGYHVWAANAENLTIESVEFASNDNRVALYTPNATGLTLTDSSFTGEYLRATIRGLGEDTTITGNTFDTANFVSGAISVENSASVSGVISNNTFTHTAGVDPIPSGSGQFKEGGEALTTIYIPGSIVTADGIAITDNQFTFTNRDAVHVNDGSTPEPKAVDFDSGAAGGPITVTGNTFTNYGFLTPPPAGVPDVVDSGDVDRGEVLQFNGVSDSLSFSLSDSIGDEGTMSMWIKLDADAVGKRNMLIEGPDNAGIEFQYRSNGGGQLYMSPNGSEATYTISSGGLATTVQSWVNVQYTWEKTGPTTGEIHIYVDGTELSYLSSFDETVPWTNVVETIGGAFKLGTDQSSTDRWFKGMMDDVALFGSVLSSTDLATVAAGTIDTTTFSSLVAHWDFDGGDPFAASGGTDVDLTAPVETLDTVTVVGGNGTVVVEDNTYTTLSGALAGKLLGGAEDDTLQGTPGNDLIIGGAGTDQAVVADNGGNPFDFDDFVFNLTVADGAASGTIAGADGTDTIAGIEVLEVANTGSSTFVVLAGMSIQAAVDAASDGDTIHLAAGTYREQVLIDGKELTFEGADGATIESPDNGDITSSGGFNSVLTAINGANVTIDNVDFDGRAQGNGFATETFAAVAFNDSDGVVTNGSITGFTLATATGAQHGYGVLARASNGTPRSVEVSDMEIVGFQKNGIDARGADLDVTISGNTITGSGGTSLQAQNGIVLVTGTTGSITGNTISELGYTGTGATADGILLFSAGDGVAITGNIVTMVDGAIANAIDLFNTNAGDISGNELYEATNGIRQNGTFTIAVPDADDNEFSGVGNALLFDVIDSSVTDFTVAGTERTDVLDGGAGIDTLNGGDGDDFLFGGEGNDDLDGGEGFDTAYFNGNAADFTFTFETDTNGKVIGFTSATDNNTGDGDEGADTLTSIEALQFGDTTVDINAPVQLFDDLGGLVSIHYSIQDAVDNALDGYSIEVAAGTYAETVAVNKQVAIIGQGDTTVISGGVDIVASGIDAANRVVLQDLKVTNSAGDGIDIGDHDFVTISGVTVEGLPGFSSAIDINFVGEASDIVIAGSTFNLAGGQIGVRVSNNAGITGFEVSDSTFNGGQYGIYIANDTTGSGDNLTGTFSGLTFDGQTNVGGDGLRGFAMYVEKLSDATISDIDVIAASGTNLNVRGINLNLKNGNFANIELDGIDFTGFDTALGLTSYNPLLVVAVKPLATLTNLSINDVSGAKNAASTGSGVIVVDIFHEAFPSQIDGVTLTGSELTGLVKIQTSDYTSITGNTITGDLELVLVDAPLVGSDLSGNTVSGVITVTEGRDAELPEGADNLALFNGTLIGGANNDQSGTGNDGDNVVTGNDGNNVLEGLGGNDTIDGGDGIDTAAYAGNAGDYSIAPGASWTVTDNNTSDGDEGTDTTNDIEILQFADSNVLLVGEGGFDTIQAAIDAASAGDTVLVAAGDYSEAVVVDKAVTILGANAGVPGQVGGGLNGARGAESVTTSFNVAAAGVTIDGFKVLDGSAILGQNAGIYVPVDDTTISNMVFERSGPVDGDTFRGIATTTGVENNLTVENSFFTGWATGFFANDYGDSSVNITGNAFINNFVGISIDDPNGTVLTDNVFDNALENVGVGVLDPVEDVSAAIEGSNSFFGVAPPVSIYGLGGSGDITGTEFADTFLDFSGGASTYSGGDGDDTFTGGTGDDTINGDGGFDTAVYAGNRADYTVTEVKDAGGTIIGFSAVVDNNATGGDEGSDTLTSIEALQFADATLNINGPVQLLDAGGNLVATYRSIQAAVDAASDGFTVEVAAGTYAENVVIDQDITILGANAGTAGSDSSRGGESVVTGSFTLASDGVTISGFQIDAPSGPAIRGGANGSVNYSNIEISDNLFVGLVDNSSQFITNGFGRGGADNGATNWLIDSNGFDGASGNDQALMRIENIDGLTITDNVATHDDGSVSGRRGIQLVGIDNGVVQGNDIDMGADGTAGVGILELFNAARYSLQIDEDSSNILVGGNGASEGNTFRNSYDGVITLGNGSIDALTVQGNTFTGQAFGFRTQAGTFGEPDTATHSNLVIVDNTFTISREAVRLSGDGTNANDPYEGIEIDGNTVTLGDPIFDDFPSGTGDPYPALGGINIPSDAILGGLVDATGTNLSDVLNGGNEDDTLSGLGGDDILNGGAGDDTLDGGADDDTIIGGVGSDTINGGDGNDTIEGNSSADFINGGAGDDVIDAGGGRDTVYFSSGNDYANGGIGNDTFVLFGTPSDYTITILGVNHFEFSNASGTTEAESFENIVFQAAAPLDAVDDGPLDADAGAITTLNVLANDSATGATIIAASLTSGDGTAAPNAAGDAVEYDLTGEYVSLAEGDTASATLLYLLSDGSTSDLATVSVTINGVDDPVGPVTDSDAATANEVTEELGADEYVGVTASAIDPDAGSSVVYSLFTNPGGAFQIDSATGVVTTTRALDREGADGTEATIVVQSTSGSTSSQESFIITILDANDNDVSVPIDTDPADDEVIENAATGTVVGITAFASDPDVGDTVTYTLDDDAGGAFAISALGVVTVADGSLIDRETDDTLSITVRATSSDTSFATETFVIDVLDDVFEFDVTAPVDTQAPAGGTVTENGTGAVGILVTASDADATTNAVTYSLEDDDGGRFVIGPVSGEVLTGSTNIDREEGAQRSITVRATSADGSFADTVFTIDVEDVNEFDVSAPTDTDANDNTVAATASVGDAVGITAEAVDLDATTNSITYSLTAGFDDFAIDPASGVVTVGAGFDPAGPITRTITVEALSADGSTASTDFDIQVGGAFNVIDGTPDRDVLNGTADRDLISGFDGIDRLSGLDGDDVLNGGAGNDRLDGGAGDDVMEGGLDNDVYIVDSVGDVVIENADEGRDTIISSVSIAALAANVEVLRLSGTADLDGTGNAIDNLIEGNSGNNVLIGGAGRDVLKGEGGNDTLIGGDDEDVLTGGAGDDVLNGGAGRDALTGDAGSDQFIIDVVASATEADLIKDFVRGEDLLVLDGTVFAALGATVDAGEIVLGSAALDADDYLIYDASVDGLFYDADGNGAGAAVLIATLAGVATLDETDFAGLI